MVCGDRRVLVPANEYDLFLLAHNILDAIGFKRLSGFPFSVFRTRDAVQYTV